MKPKANVIIFRRDLRIIDNIALYEGSKNTPVLCVYLHDTSNPRDLNRRNKWYLHHSIISLQQDLKAKYNINLQLFVGGISDLIEVLQPIIEIMGIYYNKIYEPWALLQDKEVMSNYQEYIFKIYNSHLLIEPEEILTISDTPFKVFSRFYDALKIKKEVRDGFKPPERMKPIDLDLHIKLNDLKLIGSDDRYDDMQPYKVGENEAVKRLDEFLEGQVRDYHASRDVPSIDGTSRLSSHINFGEISMVYIWHVVSMSPSHIGNVQKFLTEIAWRTFASYVLYHNPKMINCSVRPHFDLYNWSEDEEEFLRWQEGRTGFPIVDAGMRELNQTGYLHNRVRMIVASYLVKHLLQPWQKGEQYFCEQLTDYDLASNCMNWQWSAGSGIDAAPFFRIFSPQRQGERFDADGEYVKYWIPELSDIPNELIHEPWSASPKILSKANVEIGKDYPERILPHDIARKRALSAYRKIRSFKGLVNE